MIFELNRCCHRCFPIESWLSPSVIRWWWSDKCVAEVFLLRRWRLFPHSIQVSNVFDSHCNRFRLNLIHFFTSQHTKKYLEVLNFNYRKKQSEPKVEFCWMEDFKFWRISTNPYQHRFNSWNVILAKLSKGLI